MRILVSGGTGFIGSHLVAALRRQGDTVACLVRKKIQWTDAGIECHAVDLSDLKGLRQSLADMQPCDAVFHFAARLPPPTHEASEALSPYLEANVSATVILLERAWHWGGKPFVYASSATVVGKPGRVPLTEEFAANPAHPYSMSKYLGELSCEHFRRKGLVPATSLRIASPYGPGMDKSTVLPLFINLARESRDIQIYGTGSRTQNFVHVSDVVRAAMLALQTSSPGVYNVGGARSVSMLDLARTIMQAVPGSRSRVVFAGKPDPQEECRWELDNVRAEMGLGYHAEMDFPSGLANYISDLNRGGSVRWWEPCASA